MMGRTCHVFSSFVCPPWGRGVGYLWPLIPDPFQGKEIRGVPPGPWSQVLLGPVKSRTGVPPPSQKGPTQEYPSAWTGPGQGYPLPPRKDQHRSTHPPGQDQDRGILPFTLPLLPPDSTYHGQDMPRVARLLRSRRRTFLFYLCWYWISTCFEYLVYQIILTIHKDLWGNLSNMNNYHLSKNHWQ